MEKAKRQLGVREETKALVQQSAKAIGRFVARRTPEVLHVLLAQSSSEGMTRERLAEMSGLTATTLRKAVVDPLLSERVLEYGPPLRFGPGLLVLSIYVGTTHMRASLVDANGRVLVSSEVEPYPGQLRETRAITGGRLRELVDILLSEARAQHPELWIHGTLRIVQISVGWPTPLDRQGFASQTSMLHRSWDGQPIKQFVADALRFDYPEARIDVMNDARAAATTAAFEHSQRQALLPNPRPNSTILMALRASGVINASAIRVPPTTSRRLGFVDASLLIGATGLGGNIGHLPVPPALLNELNHGLPNGLTPLRPTSSCSCGAKGHLEGFASSGAVIGRLPTSEVAVVNRQTAMFLRDRLVRDQDELVERAVADAGSMIAQALSGAIALLDPEMLVVSGYLASRPLISELEKGLTTRRTQVTESEDPEGTAVRRGLALSAFRRVVFKHLDRLGSDKDWWQTLAAPVVEKTAGAAKSKA